MIIHRLLLIMLKTPVTTSDGTILTFWHLARLNLFIQDLQPALNANVSSEKLLFHLLV